MNVRTLLQILIQTNPNYEIKIRSAEHGDVPITGYKVGPAEWKADQLADLKTLYLEIYPT